MRLTWSTIFKILLSIALCAICIFVYRWFTKPKEGFQTTQTATTTIPITTRATYGGINSPITNGDPKAASQIVQIPTITKPVNSILFILRAQLSSYEKNMPVTIISTGLEVSNCRLFSYNYPYLVISANSGNPWTATATGVKWSATGSELPLTTEYTLQVNFCDVYINKSNSVCHQQKIGGLVKETLVEEKLYDSYEMYNFPTLPLPVTTQAVRYEMAQELTEFDASAPIPWDYDNRVLDPKDVLWGNIHPNVSQSIFSTAYARDMLKSINNLEYDIDRGWSYRSPMFERTWSGDDQRFLPGIQVAEFLAQTAIALAVPKVQEDVVGAYLNSTRWGSEAAKTLDGAKEARRAQVVMYKGLVENGISKKEAKAFAQTYKNTYFDNMLKMNTLSDADRALCKAEYDTFMNSATKTSTGRVNINDIMEAHEKQFLKADELYNKKVLASATDASSLTATPMANKATVASAGEVVEKTAGEVVERAQKFDNRFVAAGIKNQSLTTETLRGISAATKKVMAEKTSGKLASQFARAIGMTLEGGGLLYAIATAICTPQGMAVCGPIVTTINVFLDIFCILCMTLIPAILEQTIPSDAVCPDGTFNIHDAMVQLPGGELGWQFITNIPGLGDGLGTFGPYICSELVADGLGTKSLGRAFLKKARVTPGYFYDSTLSIYCNTNKAAMSPDNAQFSDRRMYTENALKGDAILQYPFWKNSGIAPIWVDFSDSRMLNKMAQFYYSYARRLATDNGDGTSTFEYITKFYGVIVSSEFSCDVQCEITKLTYYNETGDIQTKYVVPLPSDAGTGATYHDRRFYFYPVQVGDDPRLNEPDRKSAKNIEDYYNGIIAGPAKFLNYATRNSYVSTNNDTNLNLLMADNVRRFIVTACTNFNGTAPNTQEVDGEGNYVGDAIVSLGKDGDPYYPPQNTINTAYLAAISNAITDPILFNTANVGTPLFTYDNKLIGFVVGDTVEAIPINTPIPDNMRLSTGTLNPSAVLNTNRKFTATVASYSSSIQVTLGTGTTRATRQGLTFKDVSQTGMTSGTYVFVIRVTARSGTTFPATNDSGCSAIRSSVYRHGLPPKDTSEPPPPIIPSYVVTAASTDFISWTPGAYTSGNNTNQAEFSTKMWKESLQDKVTSTSSSVYSIAQSSVMGYVGFRYSYRGFPTGALITGGILSTNFTPEWSISSLLACSYQDLMKNTGAYIINGSIIEIQIGTDNKYLFVDRGPTIPFAVGYEPSINYQIIDLQQTDCVNRIAVRKAVNAYNSLPVASRSIGVFPSQVSKVLKIETDTQNQKCLYLFETQALDPATNIRNPIVNKNIVAIMPYKYSTPSSDSNTKVMPNLALIPNISEMQTATLNTDGSISASIAFIRTIRSTDFSSASPSLLSTYSTLKNITINRNGINDGGVFTAADDVRNIARRGNTLGKQVYTCDDADIKKRLITQFNLQTNNNPRINAITSTYYPESGSIRGDGTVQCIYSTTVVTTRPNGTSDTTNVGILMSLTKANEPTNSLYDMVYNDYPAAYIYPPIPKAGQWITIPAPLPLSRNILRTGCTKVDMSGCANIEIMTNLVNGFNTKVTDGKIMKVRKAYTPLVTGSYVCDYEVEMLRTINETSTLIQKETIRLPIVPSPSPELCMWDLNYPETTVPNPNTGLSLVNSASIEQLSTPYIWGQSFMVTVQSKINNAIRDYIGIGIKDILSNTSMSINNEAKNVYNTLLTSISLYSPLANCKKTCKDITQEIIDQYYIDNYPIRQYGSQKKEMVAVRRIGTYNNNTCQIEFIEKVATYANFISSPIFTDNPLSIDAEFNTRYYLRQYEFKTIPDTNVCAFDIQSIRDNVVLKNAFNIIDLSGNADAIMSDASEITSNVSNNFKYSGREIDCLHPNILNRIKTIYDTLYELNVAGRPAQYPTLDAISTAFNPRANVCEYTAIVTQPFKSMSGSIYRVGKIPVTLRAQWNSYKPRTMSYTLGSATLQPNSLEEFDPTKIRGEIQTDTTYDFYNSFNNKVIIPYTYLLPPNFNSTIVSTTDVVFT